MNPAGAPMGEELRVLNALIGVKERREKRLVVYAVVVWVLWFLLLSMYMGTQRAGIALLSVVGVALVAALLASRRRASLADIRASLQGIESQLKALAADRAER